MKFHLAVFFLFGSILLSSCNSGSSEKAGPDESNKISYPDSEKKENEVRRIYLTTPENCFQPIKEYELLLANYKAFAEEFEKSAGTMAPAQGEEIKLKGDEVEGQIMNEGIDKIGTDCWIQYSKLSLEFSRTAVKVKEMMRKL